MTKRLLVIAVICICGGTLVLTQWQPDNLKKWVVDLAVHQATKTAPIDILIGHVSGNLCKSFSLENVVLISKEDHKTLGRAKAITLDYSPRALLHRTIQINHLHIVQSNGETLLQCRLEAVRLSSASFRVAMEGVLAKGPLHLDILWDSSSIKRADWEWNASDFGSASGHLSEGKGPFYIHTSFAGLKASVRGTADLLKREIHGQGAAQNILWKGQQLSQIRFTFNTIGGSYQEWDIRSSLKVGNGTSADLAGRLMHGKELSRFTWQRLVFVFPAGGSWIAQRTGSLTWGNDQPFEIHHLKLTNGPQSLEIPHAIFGGGETRLTFLARQLDPGPWATLFWPGLLIQGGLINASLTMSGSPTHDHVKGFLTGKIQNLEYAPIGLVIQNIDMDIQGAGRRWDVRRFTGKTKKGDIQITGGSLWPALDYTLRAGELSIRMPPSIKGTGDLVIHLGGTAESPSLTTQLTIKEGTYTLPKENKRKSPPKTPAPAPPPPQNKSNLWAKTLLDGHVQWPRNVWYREGVTGIETQGDLRIQKPKNSTTPLLTGTIVSVRGTYNYLGRDFTIETGQLQFTGTPEMIPLINAVASYRGDAAVVYLDITGSLSQLQLKLRSNPPLSEQDIVSVIVFGRPLSELRSRTGGQTANQQMMQAVGGVLGSYATKELRQTGISELHVDVLNLQPTQQGSQLTVGRYVGRRFFVSYGQAVRGSAEKTFTANYFLTDKWTLQGTTDSSQGDTLDFLFRYPLKKGASSNTPPLPASPFRNSLDPLNPLRRDFGQ